MVVDGQETLSCFELIYLFYFALCMLMESPFPTSTCDKTNHNNSFNRDTIASVPAVEVPSWVSVDDIAIKIYSFLATLIVYDSGEHHIYV